VLCRKFDKGNEAWRRLFTNDGMLHASCKCVGKTVPYFEVDGEGASPKPIPGSHPASELVGPRDNINLKKYLGKMHGTTSHTTPTPCPCRQRSNQKNAQISTQKSTNIQIVRQRKKGKQKLCIIKKT